MFELYINKFDNLLSKLILLSYINEKDLIRFIIYHYKLIKQFLPWQFLQIKFYSPSGIVIKKQIGKGNKIIGKISEKSSPIYIDYINILHLQKKNAVIGFNVIFEKRKIFSDILVLKSEFEVKREDLNFYYRNIKLLAIEGYKLIEARHKMVQQDLLRKFSYILNSTLEPEAIQRKAVEAITNVVDSEVGSLLLLDEKTSELRFQVALGEKEEKIKEIKLKLGEGVAGWVALHGKPLLINDCKRDKRFSPLIDKLTNFETKNMLCVPVKVKDKTIGVLQAINKKNDGKFKEEDLKLLSSLSEQVAIALENARLFNELQELFLESARALAEAIEKRDPYTGGHIWRVVNYSLAIAKYLNLSKEDLFYLKLAAILHDIGKIGVDDNILRKPAPLDFNEFEIMKKHPIMGAEIIKPIKQLENILPGILYHQERYDGKGYPFKLKGDEIPLIAKIISVADTFDAMCSSRPYRSALTPEEGKKEIARCSGTQFDPEVVKAFIKAFNKGEITNVMSLSQSSK